MGWGGVGRYSHLGGEEGGGEGKLQRESNFQWVVGELLNSDFIQIFPSKYVPLPQVSPITANTISECVFIFWGEGGGADHKHWRISATLCDKYSEFFNIPWIRLKEIRTLAQRRNVPAAQEHDRLN